jgi:hypothetical protein
MLRASIALALTPLLSPLDPQGEGAPAGFDHTHAAWTRVLAEHVEGDRFDYEALAKERGELDAYLETLHGVTPAELAGWSRTQRYAFWINVYNANTIRLIVDHYPLDSIKDLSTVFEKIWDREFIPMPELHPKGKGDDLSLDDVEHQILRPRFEDARVHVAVNCASLGCPPLRPEAFVAERLEAQLDDQARRFVSDDLRNRFDLGNRRAEVSQLFNWFSGDFQRDAGGAREWLAEFADEELASWLREDRPTLSFLPYSWELNDVEKPGRSR